MEQVISIGSDIGSPYVFDMPRVINMQRYIDNGYIFYEQGILIDDLDALVEQVHTKGSIIDLRPYNHRLVIETSEYILICEEHSKSIILMAKNYEAINKFLVDYIDLIQKYDNESANVDYYFYCKQEVKSQHINLPFSKLPLVVPELYPDIDVQRLSQDFKASDDSILILYGEPGVGKTTYLKYLLQTRDYHSVGYIKDLHVMMSSDFWSTVASMSYDLLVFDDLDFALGPRAEGEHSGFVSNLLSYSDGIFNHNRSKIVITTNQAIDRIDNALVRPGRCFDFLVLNPLTTEQAIKIWVEILDMSATDFFQLYGEAETITQAALMSDCKRLKAALMERRYIKGRDKFYTVEDKLSKHGVAADSRRYAGFSA